jgi:hypothetical protein
MPPGYFLGAVPGGYLRSTGRELLASAIVVDSGSVSTEPVAERRPVAERKV